MKKTALHYIISTVLIVLPNLCALGVLVADFKVGGWLAKHNIIQTDLFDEDKN